MSASVTDFAVITASSVEPAVADTAPDPDARTRPVKDWFSGFCGPGSEPCRDGSIVNKVGEPIRWCRYMATNGSNAPLLHLYCACECHDSERVPDDPAYQQS
mgnify:CR=1 FL=1